ncbi:hypothetical protein JHK86_010063 [Glycine max]|nr:hypothetical protein JHK86_010063 [Glycine max]
MGEQLGLLKVIVVQGKRLVIRDFKTSDPYVVCAQARESGPSKKDRRSCNGHQEVKGVVRSS